MEEEKPGSSAAILGVRPASTISVLRVVSRFQAAEVLSPRGETGKYGSEQGADVKKKFCAR
jgi:hypothetical protein